MWSSVVGLALLAGLNLVRLGLTLLVIARPRSVQNLLALCAGCLTGAIPVVVVPLALLHVTPMFTSFTQGSANPATDSMIRHVQLGMGLLALLIAALMTVRSQTRRRQQARMPTPADTTSTRVLDSNRPTAVSRLLGRAQDEPTEGESAIRRLLRRVHNAWENGSLWFAYVMGIVFGGPPPGEAIFLFAIILTSGAAVGAQVMAAIVYLVGMLAVIEIMLVGYVATPAKTHALLGRLHDWASAHRRQVVVAIFVAVGVAMVARGMGSI